MFFSFSFYPLINVFKLFTMLSNNLLTSKIVTYVYKLTEFKLSSIKGAFNVFTLQ